MKKQTEKMRVWLVLRERGPMARREIMAALPDKTEGGIECALTALRKCGSARHCGTYSSAGTWHATRVVPVDLRGMHPNSAKNRVKGQCVNAEWARLTCGMLPKPETELERCWI